MYYKKLLHQELQKRAKFIEKALMLWLMCEIFVDITLILIPIQNIDYQNKVVWPNYWVDYRFNLVPSNWWIIIGFHWSKNL